MSWPPRWCLQVSGVPSARTPAEMASRTGECHSLGGLRQELLALTGTPTTDAALSGDPRALHDRSGASLADAPQPADDTGGRRLPPPVIITAQHIAERESS